MNKHVKHLTLITALFGLFLTCSNNMVVNASTNGATTPPSIYETDASTYYASTEGLSGKELLNELASIMTNTHQTYTSYEEIKGGNALSDQDIDNPENVILFYSGASISNAWNSSIWNREHVWCKSLSGGLYTSVNEGSRNAGTDLHQLKPAATSVNTSRNNKPYADLNKTGTEVTYNGEGTGCYSKDNLFEPRDEVKGDVARILMYMYTHYSNEVEKATESKKGFMKIENIVYTEAKTAKASWDLLLKWNKMDPVDDFEARRNNYVASVQGNRNPYIDHPEFAGMIWDINYAGNGALTDKIGIYTNNKLELSTYQKEIVLKDSYQLTCATIPTTATYSYTSTNSSVADVDNTGKITAKSTGYTNIVVTSTNGVSKECVVKVTNESKTESIYKDKSYTYTITDYPTGTSYIENEEHVLDSNVTLYVNNGFFSTEIRIYSSQTHDTTVYTNTLPAYISGLTLTAGYSKDTLLVYGATEGKEMVLVEEVAITSTSYTDYFVDFSAYNYDSFLLDVKGTNQVRLKAFSIQYQEDVICEDKLYEASDSINPSLFIQPDTGSITSYNNYSYTYDNVEKSENGNLYTSENFSLYNSDSYGYISKINISSMFNVNVSFGSTKFPTSGESYTDVNGIVECKENYEYFKVESSSANVIYNIVVYYIPVSQVKLQKGENGAIRVVAEINHRQYDNVGFVINGMEVQMSSVKKEINVNSSKVSSSFVRGYFMTYELKLAAGTYDIYAYVQANDFEKVYSKVRVVEIK